MERGNNYQLHLVGSGAYADVFKYYDQYYKTTFALKKLKKNSTVKDIERFKKEYEFMRDFRYPYITTVYGFDDTENSYSMEYCQYNLEKFLLANNTKLSFSQRKSMAMQFLKGLAYLHEKNILHRDLSYTNILVNQYDDVIVVKLSDFGLAKKQEEIYTKSDSSIKGTILDPCLDSFKSYDVQNEMYAIGIILWYIFTGRKNYKTEQTAVSKAVAKCIDSNKSARYRSVKELLNEISGIQHSNDSPKMPLDIKVIKSKIVEELYGFSANELPEICTSLGLKDGEVSEAFSSKRQYVAKRLHVLDINGCMQLINKIERQLGYKINLTFDY